MKLETPAESASTLNKEGVGSVIAASGGVDKKGGAAGEAKEPLKRGAAEVSRNRSVDERL